MKKTSMRAFLLVACACATAFPVHAECTLPRPPSKIPDGATTSDAEMTTFMAVMSGFETDVENYIKCLKFENSQGRVAKDVQTRLTAEALERHQDVVSRFNAQMRSYMAR